MLGFAIRLKAVGFFFPKDSQVFRVQIIPTDKEKLNKIKREMVLRSWPMGIWWQLAT